MIGKTKSQIIDGVTTNKWQNNDKLSTEPRKVKTLGPLTTQVKVWIRDIPSPVNLGIFRSNWVGFGFPFRYGDFFDPYISSFDPSRNVYDLVFFSYFTSNCSQTVSNGFYQSKPKPNHWKIKPEPNKTVTNSLIPVWFHGLETWICINNSMTYSISYLDSTVRQNELEKLKINQNTHTN